MQEDEISFKDASTLIGRSLVSEFSELDSNESVCGDEAVNVSFRKDMDLWYLMRLLKEAYLMIHRFSYTFPIILHSIYLLRCVGVVVEFAPERGSRWPTYELACQESIFAALARL